MIYSKDVKIKTTDNLTADYIENELKNMGFDVLRWAITEVDEKYYTLNLAIVSD